MKQKNNPNAVFGPGAAAVVEVLVPKTKVAAKWSRPTRSSRTSAPTQEGTINLLQAAVLTTLPRGHKGHFSDSASFFKTSELLKSTFRAFRRRASQVTENPGLEVDAACFCDHSAGRRRARGMIPEQEVSNKMYYVI